MADYKRIYILAGHYGSGKTNVAVNLALKMKKDGLEVKIADLDIVNPYFRTKDSIKTLTEAGIPLISPAFANTNVDLPALPQEAYSLVQRTDSYAVLDVGGDDRGAYALGRYAPYILEENNFEMCYVFNCYRPLTRTAEEAFEVIKEIEAACKIPFTAIINNSNVGNDTDADAIIASEKETERLSALTGLPVIFTSVREDIKVDVINKLPLSLQEKYFDIKES
jgi:hypothetical protein